MATLRDPRRAPSHPGELLREDILPALPLMAQQRVMADFNVYFKKLSNYLDDPDFEDLVTVSQPMPEPSAQQGPPSAPKPGGEKSYRRISESAATDKGQGTNQITQLITGNSQGGRQQQPAMAGAQ